MANDYYLASGEPRENGLPQEKLRREFRSIQDAFDKVSQPTTLLIDGGTATTSAGAYVFRFDFGGAS